MPPVEIDDDIDQRFGYIRSSDTDTDTDSDARRQRRQRRVHTQRRSGQSSTTDDESANEMQDRDRTNRTNRINRTMNQTPTTPPSTYTTPTTPHTHTPTPPHNASNTNTNANANANANANTTANAPTTPMRATPHRTVIIDDSTVELNTMPANVTADESSGGGGRRKKIRREYGWLARDSLDGRRTRMIGRPGTRRHRRWLNDVLLGRRPDVTADEPIASELEPLDCFLRERVTTSPLSQLFVHPDRMVVFEPFLELTEERELQLLAAAASRRRRQRHRHHHSGQSNTAAFAASPAQRYARLDRRARGALRDYSRSDTPINFNINTHTNYNANKNKHKKQKHNHHHQFDAPSASIDRNESINFDQSSLVDELDQHFEAFVSDCQSMSDNEQPIGQSMSVSHESCHEQLVSPLHFKSFFVIQPSYTSSSSSSSSSSASSASHLLLLMKDSFHRLMCHGVCEYYGLESHSCSSDDALSLLDEQAHSMLAQDHWLKQCSIGCSPLGDKIIVVSLPKHKPAPLLPSASLSAYLSDLNCRSSRYNRFVEIGDFDDDDDDYDDDYQYDEYTYDEGELVTEIEIEIVLPHDTQSLNVRHNRSHIPTTRNNHSQRNSSRRTSSRTQPQPQPQPQPLHSTRSTRNDRSGSESERDWESDNANGMQSRTKRRRQRSNPHHHQTPRRPQHYRHHQYL